MVARVRGRRRAPRRPAAGASRAALLLASAALIAGCGGGGARQDAHEPEGTFPMRIVHASFPAAQSIARPTRMVLAVRNTGTQTIPNVAVTVNSFEYIEHYPELAANKRPVWVIERGPGAVARPPVQSVEVSKPGGSQTVYVNTWAMGPLAPGRIAVFSWLVVPVKPGMHTVHFVFAAGLAGRAQAVQAGGGPVQGQFRVHVAYKPPVTHVNPETGKVEKGPFPPPS